MELEKFDDLLKEALETPDARYAFKENALRRRLGAALDQARAAKGLTVRQLASKMGTSTSQVQRLLHGEVGGSVTLASLCRAADALDLRVDIHVRPQQRGTGNLLHFGGGGWTPATEIVTDAETRTAASPTLRLAASADVKSSWKPSESVAPEPRAADTGG